MKLEYDNSRVKKYFCDFELMNKKIGKNLTKSIKKLYDQLKAAENFGIYLNTGLGKPHSLSGDLNGYYGISISGNARLVVRPKSDSLDPDSLKQCDKGVMDYHGQKHKWFVP